MIDLKDAVPMLFTPPVTPTNFVPWRNICASLVLALSLSGCSLLPPPVRAQVYDFGPGVREQSPSGQTADGSPPVALDEVVSGAALDSTAMLYRLAYSDARQLRPYAQARWSMTPAQLLQQRLREQLGRHRTVLRSEDGIVLMPPSMTLHIALEEFSQIFDTPQSSSAVLRLRVALGQPGLPPAAREKLVAQRSFVVQRPSPSPDAAGGAQAMAAAVDAVSEDIDRWLQQAQSERQSP